ncbi:MAG: hypothetical protein LBI95_01590 [Holosporales bacterium]|nr:hypothetical protein [Holosporales bacterium]
MKKILYTMIAVVGICGVNEGMDISYHSLVENKKKQEFLTPPVCRNYAELQNRMHGNTLRFITASPLNKEKVAGELLPEYEHIFCTDIEQLPVLKQLEEKVSTTSLAKLSEESLSELVDEIAYLCDGLSEAATKMQNMYEVKGDYPRALLWALVSYKFGNQMAKEAIGRLLVGMGK